MNKIRLNFQEMQEILILPEPDEMVAIWEHINEYGFSFDDFTLVIEPLNQVIKVNIEGRKDDQIFHVKIIKTNRNGLTSSRTYDIGIDEFFDEYATTMREVFSNGFTRDAINNDAVDLILPFHFMQYVIYSERHRNIEYIESAQRSGSSKSHKRTSQNTTHEYSLTDCIRIYHSTNKNRKKYEITCDSWNVRGFFRHYKNGKIVWVKPFKKGKNRNDLDVKNYKL